ncbi:MAG: hypothetical protein F6J87_09815 [Spirulina sp. SIO3F2]|nr:hypothetical protein [Spirulina sp. SIO3F2]
MESQMSNNSPELLIDFNPDGRMREVSLRGVDASELADKSARAVEKAMNTIQRMADKTWETVDSLANRPSQVEVEFGITFDVESGALIAKTGVEASLNVKLVWERDQA